MTICVFFLFRSSIAFIASNVGNALPLKQCIQNHVFCRTVSIVAKSLTISFINCSCSQESFCTQTMGNWLENAYYILYANYCLSQKNNVFKSKSVGKIKLAFTFKDTLDRHLLLLEIAHKRAAHWLRILLSSINRGSSQKRLEMFRFR